jgi:YD repeat-containing protein
LEAVYDDTKITIIDQLRHYLTYHYDKLGRLTDVKQYTGEYGSGTLYATVSRTHQYNDLVASVTDPGNDSYTYTYDFLGHCTQIQYPDSWRHTNGISQLLLGNVLMLSRIVFCFGSRTIYADDKIEEARNGTLNRMIPQENAINASSRGQPARSTGESWSAAEPRSSVKKRRRNDYHEKNHTERYGRDIYSILRLVCFSLDLHNYFPSLVSS